MNEKITGKIHSIDFWSRGWSRCAVYRFHARLPDEMQILSQSGDLAGKLRWRLAGRSPLKEGFALPHVLGKWWRNYSQRWRTLLQIEFLIEFLNWRKQEGIHTALDTSANPYTKEEPFHSKWLELMKYTDLVILDLKEMDEENIRNWQAVQTVIF